MKIVDYTICNNFNWFLEKKIVLYGTGEYGEIVYSWIRDGLGKDILCACNSESSEHFFYGNKIYSIAQVKEKYDEADVLIVVTSVDYWKEMINCCEKLQFSNAEVSTYYGLFISILLHLEDDRILPDFRRKIQLKRQIGSFWQHSGYRQYIASTMVSVIQEIPQAVLIYQPGKVGSSSLGSSIRKKNVHVHMLTLQYANKREEGFLLKEYVKNLSKKEKMQIITCIREPIARDISGYYYDSDTEIGRFNYDVKVGDLLWYGDNINGEKDNLPERSIDVKGDLHTGFSTYGNALIRYKSDEFSWFDYEIKNIFDIDIYDYPFDKEQGYGIIRKDNIEILVLKLEKMSECEKVIGDFVGEEDFHLVRDNEAKNKVYNYIYQEFKKNVLLDREYYDYYYNGPQTHHMEHFYTAEEMQKFRDKWSRHIKEEKI